MTPHDIVAALGTYGGAFVVGAISSIIPFVSIDLFLIGLTIATGTSVAVAIPVVPLASAGQLAGKLPLYAASRGVANVHGPHRERLERMRTCVARWQNAPDLVLRSAPSSGCRRSPSWRPPPASSRSACRHSARRVAGRAARSRA